MYQNYPNQNQFVQNPATLNPYQENLDIVKNFFKKPIVLAVAIVAAISVIASMIFSFYVNNSLTSLLNALSDVIADDSFSFQATGYDVSSIFSSLVSLAIPALPVVAFFLIYFKSKNPDPASNPSAGFTILWVLSIIGLVGLSIGALFCVLGVIAMTFLLVLNTSAPSDVPITAGLLIFLLIFIVVFMGIAFFYQISQLRFYSSVRKSTQGLALESKGAAPYGVLAIIFGIFSGFGVLSVLSLPAMMQTISQNISFTVKEAYLFSAIIDYFSNLTLFAVIINLLAAVQSILIGVVAFGYNTYIKNLTSSFPTGGNQLNTNPYEQNQYNANPYEQTQNDPQNPYNNN